MFKKQQYECAVCKYVGPAKTHTPGSIRLELLLWLTFIFGIFYSFWRMGARKKVCGRCGSPNIRPHVK